MTKRAAPEFTSSVRLWSAFGSAPLRYCHMVPPRDRVGTCDVESFAVVKLCHEAKVEAVVVVVVVVGMVVVVVGAWSWQSGI